MMMLIMLFIVTFSGERPFKCKFCGKAFASHAAHDSHVRRTHSKERPCVCELCGKAFAQPYELKFHMNVHTGGYKMCDLLFNKDKCFVHKGASSKPQPHPPTFFKQY